MTGDFRYAEDWDPLGYAVKKAAAFRCFVCSGRSSWKRGCQLVVHHRDGNPKNWAVDNTVALCERCDASVEAGTVTLNPAQLLLGFT